MDIIAWNGQESDVSYHYIATDQSLNVWCDLKTMVSSFMGGGTIADLVTSFLIEPRHTCVLGVIRDFSLVYPSIRFLYSHLVRNLKQSFSRDSVMDLMSVVAKDANVEILIYRPEHDTWYVMKGRNPIKKIQSHIDGQLSEICMECGQRLRALR